jgi:hypothetical protein
MVVCSNDKANSYLLKTLCHLTPAITPNFKSCRRHVSQVPQLSYSHVFTQFHVIVQNVVPSLFTVYSTAVQPLFSYTSRIDMARLWPSYSCVLHFEAAGALYPIFIIANDVTNSGASSAGGGC